MFQTLLLIITNVIARLIKCSPIIGSSLLFSANNCVMPLGALFGGYFGLFMSIAFWALYSIIFAKKAFFLTFFGMVALLRIPTIVAALFLKNRSAAFASGISVLCITLFLLHPEGYLAAPYALYWFIPPVLSFIFKDLFFARCLSATLLQHAVGSVIFLYKTNMSASYWYSLIPVVAVERLLFASGMVIAYHAIICAQQLVLNRYGPVKRISLSEPSHNNIETL